MVTCTWCGTKGRHSRWSTKNADDLWVYICKKCGREFLSEHPTDAELGISGE